MGEFNLAASSKTCSVLPAIPFKTAWCSNVKPWSSDSSSKLDLRCLKYSSSKSKLLPSNSDNKRFQSRTLGNKSVEIGLELWRNYRLDLIERCEILFSVSCVFFSFS